MVTKLYGNICKDHCISVLEVMKDQPRVASTQAEVVRELSVPLQVFWFGFSFSGKERKKRKNKINERP